MRGAILLLLFVVAGIWAGPVSRPVAVEDTTLLRWLMDDVGSTGALPSGDWSIAPVSSEDHRLILFHNGTEYRRFSKDITAKILTSYPDAFADTLSPRTEDRQGSLQRVKPNWDLFDSKNGEKLDGLWFQQKDGIDVGRILNSSRGERWWIQDQYWIQASKIWGSTKVSLGFIRSSDYMNIQREMREYYGTNTFSDYSWQIALTWKAFTYQAQTWSWVLPEYYWFEQDVDTLWAASIAGDKDGAEGKVVHQYALASDSSLGSDFENNLIHRFEARFWYLRYSLMLDGDRYTGAIHRIAFEDLENSWGSWGTFAVGCGGVWVPGFWFEAGPAFSLGTPKAGSWNSISWMPLRFEMMYENTTHFRLQFGTRIHWGGS